MVSTMPPSTRRAAPLVAEASFEADIDYHVCDFLDAGKALQQRARAQLLDELPAASSVDWPFCLARSFTKVSTPSDMVGPGRTALTVTPVPGWSRQARGRERAARSW